MKTLAEIKMSPEDYAKGVKLSGKRATDLLKHSWAQHDASKDKQKAGDTEGASNALKVSGRAHKLYLKAKERHLKDPANAENHARAMMSGASDYYKKAKPGQYVGDSIEVAHDGKQIDELSKDRLVKEANIEPTSAASRSHIGNLSNPITNTVVHPSSGKEIGIITKQPSGEYYAHHSAAKLSHAESGTFDTKDRAHQFIRNAHAKAIKNDTLSDRWKKSKPLPQFQSKETNEAKDAREYDYEGDMAKSQLRSIISNAQTIHDMLKDDTNMAEWVQNKITLSADYISTVRDYMSSETNEENTMDKIHPDALHVKPVEVNGKTKYKVHAVGSNFSDGIKKGEHLSDTELDDFSEMGGKIKHMKEQRSLNDILDEARGRPRKNPVAAPAKKSGDDEEEDYGPDTGPEADQHIQNQLKRAHDARDVEGGMKGGADVKFENGKKHFIKSEHAHKVLTALERLKPADRAEAASHVYKSHENFQAVHSMLK